MKNVVLSFVLLTSILLSVVPTIKSQSKASVEKIELIIKLTKFIDWYGKNEALNSKQLLYVLTDNELPINYEIRTQKNTIYKNWKVICTKTIEDFEEGAAVFISKNKKSYTNKVIALSADKNILTITEEDNNFCSQGGMINISGKNNGHKFEINYKIIQQKSLNISSKVLALAKIYDE
jgi:hypothetical protein